MGMLDAKALAEATALIVKSHVEAAVESVVAPLLRRIGDLEKRTPEKGADGRDGADGKDGAHGRDGVDGAPGRDGKDAEPVSEEQIAEAVARYLEANPPAAGKDGRDGVDGRDGRDGEPGAKGDAGNDGAPGRDGRDGTNGKDGFALSAGVIDRDGNLILTLSNGDQKNLGCVVGRDGAPGKDGAPGRDGFSLKDFDTEMLPDGRTILLKFESGDILETHELCFPVVLDQGVWKEDRDAPYLKGDGVTWGGSFWIAQRVNPGKPDTPNSGWRLAVKKGQNGKDAK